MVINRDGQCHPELVEGSPSFCFECIKKALAQNY